MKTEYPQCFQYYVDIVEGRIPHCKHIGLMAKRELDDYRERQHRDDFEFFFDAKKANREVKYYRGYKFVDGRRGEANDYFEPEPWQVAFFSSLSGWRLKSDKKVRRYVVAHLFIGRKNGKSTMAALMALRELHLGDAGGQVYSIATKQDQARISFDYAHDMLRKLGSDHPLLLHTNVFADYMMVKRQGGSVRRWKPLSSRAAGAEGVSASMVIVDEAALITDRKLIESLMESTRARHNPLTLFVTTAQPQFDTLYLEQREILKTALERGSGADRIFGLLYQVDRARPDESDEELYERIAADKELWIHANPNLGKSLYLSAIEMEMDDARANRNKRPSVLLKTFNCFASDAVKWISPDMWDSNPDCRRQGNVYMGIDMADTHDLAAVVVMWDHGNDTASVEAHCFCPERARAELPMAIKQIYGAAIEEGALHIMGDRVLDRQAFQAWLFEKCANIKPKLIGLDPNRAGELMVALEGQGHKVNKVRQGAALTPAINDLESYIMSGRLGHTGCKFLRWQMMNVCKTMNTYGNVRLTKEGFNLKIDAPIALCCAMMVKMGGSQDIGHFTVMGLGDVEVKDAEGGVELPPDNDPDGFGVDVRHGYQPPPPVVRD